MVRSGGDVDDWLDDLVDNAGSDAPVLTLIDHVRTRRDGDDVDPHWWQDPRNAELAVAAIRDRLAEADPAGGAPTGAMPRATWTGSQGSTATPPPASSGSRHAPASS